MRVSAGKAKMEAGGRGWKAGGEGLIYSEPRRSRRVVSNTGGPSTSQRIHGQGFMECDTGAFSASPTQLDSIVL